MPAAFVFYKNCPGSSVHIRSTVNLFIIITVITVLIAWY